jgi:hypothetical protein
MEFCIGCLIPTMGPLVAVSHCFPMKMRMLARQGLLAFHPRSASRLPLAAPESANLIPLRDSLPWNPRDLDQPFPR